jgi:hypothetical protein
MGRMRMLTLRRTYIQWSSSNRKCGTDPEYTNIKQINRVKAPNQDSPDPQIQTDNN